MADHGGTGESESAPTPPPLRIQLNQAADFAKLPSCISTRRVIMADSIYKIIELVGTSPTSWEDAAKNAVEMATKTLRDLRIAEVVKLDMRVDNGKVVEYRARVNLSFKYEGGD